MKENKKNFPYIFFIALIFTFVPYVFNFVKIKDIFDFLDLVKKGLPLLTKEITKLSFYSSLSIVQVVVVWALIGAIAYSLYYYLNSSYCFAYNILVTKYYYSHPEQEEFNLSRKLRILTHFLMILAYSVLFVFILTVMIPFGEILRIKTYDILNFLTARPRDVLSYALLYCYWFLGIYILSLVTKKIKEAIFLEKLDEEHCPL